MIKEWIKDFFYLTPTERKGTAFLSLLTFIAVLAPFFYRFFFKNEPNDIAALRLEAEKAKAIMQPSAQNADAEKDFENYQPFPFNPNTATVEDFGKLGLSPKVANTIVHFREKGGKFYKAEDFKKIWGLSPSDYERLHDYINIESVKYAKKEGFSGYNHKEEEKIVVELGNFDPNTAEIDDLLKLGIPKKTAYIILKYREKGGHFRKKEDLKKIYGMEEVYAGLEPFIQIVAPQQNTTQSFASNTPQNANGNIPSNVPTAYNNTFQKKFAPAFVGNIDINKATEEDWKKLPGIGPGYAKRILSFREKLGGFANIEQVKETFGLPDSTFQKAKPHLVASEVFRKINISSATEEQLKEHPYIKWHEASLIFNFRTMHGGKFANYEEFKKVNGLKPEFLEKIKPYLAYQ
jgi:competence ComEA-like helix-hairpin-helix protein